MIYGHLDDLTELQKEVMNLRFIGDLSLKETADTLSKNVNAVKAIQHAALKKLKDKVKKTNTNNLRTGAVSY